MQESIDPSELLESLDEKKVFEPQPKKKRGRKSGGPTAAKREKMSSKQLSGILLIGHSAVAEMTQINELVISEDEAGQLAAAIVDVMQHYDFEASAKTLAWANLVGTMAVIYGVKLWGFLDAQKERQKSTKNLTDAIVR